MPFKRGQLRYFVTVAEEGQITRAAAKLHVAQPALSQSIAQLESELGFELLERHPRGVKLTAEGEIFLVKARAALAAQDDAAQLARSLAREARGTIEFGFVGSAPGLDSPGQLEAFALVHPEIDIRYVELAFPTPPTRSWLSAVDVAVCHAPPPDENVWTMTLRVEPRAVLAPLRHPLAQRAELSVAEVLDETFIGLHQSIDPTWAGFWSLDDHRGGPPERITPDHAVNPHEVLAALAVRSAITTIPASVERLIVNAATGLVAIPLRGAEPCAIQMVGREEPHNAAVAALLAFARDAMGGGAPGSA